MSLTSARLRALSAVLEEGSFSAAARRLGTTQPSISKSIQDLERSFGVKLFEKRGRSLIPTKLSIDLGPLAEDISRLEAQALTILQRHNSIAEGKLMVGLGNSMPGLAIIGNFLRLVPTVKVDVEFGNFSEVIDAVLDNRVDIGLLPNLPDDKRFIRKTCVTQDIVAIVHPEHRLAKASTISLRDISDEPLIFRSKGSSTQRVVDKSLERLGLKIEPVMTLDTRDGVCEAVANSIGVGFIWRHGTSRQGDFIRLPIREIEETYDEVLFYRSGEKNTIVELFVASTNMNAN